MVKGRKTEERSFMESRPADEKMTEKAEGGVIKEVAEGEQKKKEATGNKGLDNMHYRDSSGKMIFEDPVLCSQFLRNYVDIPMLKDVQPEDIEDVTERYVHMFVEERNSDIVKKVNLKENSFYLVSLIEHKSDVDYNVVMQVFRYITFIWEDYEKFSKELNETFLEEVTGESPEYLLKIMSQVIRMFLAKLNVPREEVDTFTEQIKERKMGELFKHFQGWDVQALRQEIEEAKEETEKAKEKVREEGIGKFIRVIKKYHVTKEEATGELMEEYELSRETAEEKVSLYW